MSCLTNMDSQRVNQNCFCGSLLFLLPSWITIGGGEEFDVDSGDIFMEELYKTGQQSVKGLWPPAPLLTLLPSLLPLLLITRGPAPVTSRKKED